jgi:hypothetical protein
MEMKALSLLILFLISSSAFSSGTTVGNGFVQQGKTEDKKDEKWCTNIKGAHIEKVNGEEVCKLKDGTLKKKENEKKEEDKKKK